MEIDDPTLDPEFPRKLLDKKTYVCIDQESGEPQVVLVEPHMHDNGEFALGVVVVTLDGGTQMIMDREAADMYIEAKGCVPLERLTDWKRPKPS